jgi:hypothetical protein
MTTVERCGCIQTMVSDTTFDVSCSQSRYVHSGSCRITRAPRGVKITGRSEAVEQWTILLPASSADTVVISHVAQRSEHQTWLEIKHRGSAKAVQ